MNLCTSVVEDALFFTEQKPFYATGQGPVGMTVFLYMAAYGKK